MNLHVDEFVLSLSFSVFFSLPLYLSGYLYLSSLSLSLSLSLFHSLCGETQGNSMMKSRDHCKGDRDKKEKKQKAK